VEPVTSLNPIEPPPALHRQKSSRTEPSEPVGAPADRVELSDEAVAASNGEARLSQPQMYGPRGTFVRDTTGREARLAANTDRSRHLSDIMSEIAAVQRSTAELLDRQRKLRI